MFPCGITSAVMATAPSVTGLYVGTSGFSYPSWRPDFYPPGTQPRDFLAYYAARLPSVELNTTGYRLPSEAQFARWAEQTPPGFRFAVKLPQRGLRSLDTFEERVGALGDRLGPVRVVFQGARDDGMLRLALDSLDRERLYAFELRDPAWGREVDDALGERGVARVGSLTGTAGFRYLRLRDPPYEDAALRDWAARLQPLLSAGIDLYCYFKHEDSPTAPRYAQALVAHVHALAFASEN